MISPFFQDDFKSMNVFVITQVTYPEINSTTPTNLISRLSRVTTHSKHSNSQIFKLAKIRTYLNAPRWPTAERRAKPIIYSLISRISVTCQYPGPGNRLRAGVPWHRSSIICIQRMNMQCECWVGDLLMAI